MFRNYETTKTASQRKANVLQNLLCKFNEQKEVTETTFVTFFGGQLLQSYDSQSPRIMAGFEGGGGHSQRVIKIINSVTNITNMQAGDILVCLVYRTPEEGRWQLVKKTRKGNRRQSQSQSQSLFRRPQAVAAKPGPLPPCLTQPGPKLRAESIKYRVYESKGLHLDDQPSYLIRFIYIYIYVKQVKHRLSLGYQPLNIKMVSRDQANANWGDVITVLAQQLRE